MYQETILQDFPKILKCLKFQKILNKWFFGTLNQVPITICVQSKQLLFFKGLETEKKQLKNAK